MGYGIDKSGWLIARFAAGQRVPVELLRGWIDESYEAIASTALPKRGVARVQPRKTTAGRR